jgi:hypothetical protein
MPASRLRRNEPEDPGWHETAWWAREDSNLQPSGYEPLALTIELRARATRTYDASVTDTL